EPVPVPEVLKSKEALAAMDISPEQIASAALAVATAKKQAQEQAEKKQEAPEQPGLLKKMYRAIAGHPTPPAAAPAPEEEPETEEDEGDHMVVDNNKKEKAKTAPQRQQPKREPAPKKPKPAMKQGQAEKGKRHRDFKDNILGITKPAIRRLARRGGVKRISADVYEETRGKLKLFLAPIVMDAVALMEYARRKTVTVGDVNYALHKNGRTLYGAVTAGEEPRPRKPAAPSPLSTAQAALAAKEEARAEKAEAAAAESMAAA
ncbi:MAG TPA: histone H4, partial [Candidatus Saccharimonadia bacterium]|nr:histone H4 [Candidatus Saccharimonadia bacterium]